MSIVNCGKRRECSGIALIASLIIGIIAAFLQITGVITLTPIFSIVAFAATSVIGAIVVGALFFFFSLMITTIACLAKCLAGCGN